MNVLKKHKNVIYKGIVYLIILLSISLYYFMDTFRDVVNILLISFIVAYILKPIKKAIVKRFNCKEKLASLTIVLGILIILVTLIILFIPNLLKEVNNFTPIVNNLLSYIDEKVEQLNIGNSAFIRYLYGVTREKLELSIELVSSKVLEEVLYIGENFLSIFIIPVIVYYLLSEEEKINKKAYLLVPLEKRTIVKTIFKDIDKLLSKYIISQLFLSLIVGILTFISLLILKVKFPLWLSILNGIFNIIPYFGPILGGIPVIFVALLDSTSKGIITTIVILIIQQIEGNLLSPKITGDSTNMHPLIIVILLLIGEKIGGVVGMIFIIPLAVIFKVMYEDINYYLF